ncbi:hybrid sensor histidine kinase/response regulator transcription factor [Anditalea andensis]|uniref:histidine kinase n=1 Tax=Anditalea andensis TaxID=1048983 RepID=A0A074L3B6_9BACT|nr:hybrid sensor histidine kinase/response regulator transcription factor [Anditalea andensis]KEO75639.1 hypothetical protein EL17_23735 [Anditalea andensis]
MCKLTIYLLLIAIGIFCNANANDKKLYFEYLDTKKGLSDNSVFCILQDSQGFIWIGTKNGLNRYDGNTFKIFDAEPNNMHGLENHHINSLIEDKNGNIWIGTSGGLYIYNPELENITRFKSSFFKSGKMMGSVSNIKCDLDGNIWIVENSSNLYKYETDKEILINYNQNPKYKQMLFGHIADITVDNSGNLWIAVNDRGLVKYAPSSGTFVEFLDEKSILNKDFVRVILDFDSTIYIGTTKGGLGTMDKKTGQFKHLIKSDNSGNSIFVRDLKIINEKEIWIASESGLYIYQPTTGNIQNVKNNINDAYSLSDNALYTIYQDRSGSIWIGTYFSGINFLPNHSSNFEKYYPISNLNSISGKRIREFVQNEKGQLWIGTEDAGLNLFDPKTKSFENFIPNSKNEGISYHNIHALALKNNELWIGVWSQGLNILNQETNKIRKDVLINKDGTTVDSDIFSIYFDRSNRAWFGTGEGLYLYHENDNYYEHIIELENHFIHDIIEDRLGNLWVATPQAGLFKFNLEDRSVKNFFPKSNDNKAISDFSVITLLFDKNNTLWLGSEGGGLCQFNESTDSFTCYNTKNGFPSNTVYKILEDNDGKLWLSNKSGVVRFDPESKHFLHYTNSNGLPNSNFNYKSGIKTDDGTIYFGTLDGFISFDPKTFNIDQFNHPLVFTAIYLSNKLVQIGGEDPILTKSISKTKDILLKHNQNSLSFEFASLNYTASNAISYAYKMEGYDNDWIFLSNNQRINYSTLPFGKYQLKVKTFNNLENWDEKELILNIEILPPFYRTNLAYSIYFIAMILIFNYIRITYKNRLNQRHNLALKSLQDEKEKEIYQSKIEFFTNITHEIRTPLTLIKGPLEFILKRASSYDRELQENLTMMNKNTDRLINLSNQLLDFRKSEKECYSLNFIRSNIGDLLVDICERFMGSVHNKHLNFKIIKPETPLYADIDKEALTKIISNLLTNAIKNASSFVHVNLEDIRTTNFKINVRNDGLVIDKNLRFKIFEPFFQIKGQSSEGISHGSGLGLPLALSLAEMHNGRLYLQENAVGNYNTFTLELPFIQQQVILMDIKELDYGEADPIEYYPSNIKTYQSGQPILLLVEDNKELLDFLFTQLQNHYQIYAVKNGELALKILEEKPVDLIMSDVMMPIMDGYKLCKAVKTNINYSHIPFVMLTAKNTIQSKIEGMEMGADAYIEKPFSMEYLLLQLKNLLNYRDQIRKSYTDNPFIDFNTMAHTHADEEFLSKVNLGILENMGNQQFGVNELANVLCMSQSSLLRKLKGVSKLTPNGYIRLVRLKKAAVLLQTGQYNIAEISEMTGFNSPSYFTKCFQKQFGELPSNYTKVA